MYYRYEVKTEDGWEGIFSIADPDWRRYIGRFLKEPAWYKKQKNPWDIPSRCWFTEYGFQKYGYLINEMIEDYKAYYPDMNIRILKQETLQQLVMKGKIQVIELLERNV